MPTKVALAAVLLIALAASRDARAEDVMRACIAASTEGQTLRNRGELIASRKQLLACAADACPAIVRTSCARWLAEVESRIPSIVVRAEHSDGTDAIHAELTVDGTQARLDGRSLSLDPGKHALAIADDDGARGSQRILLRERETGRLVTVRLAPHSAIGGEARPETAGRDHRGIPIGAWLLGGAGALALGTGAGFAIAANSDLNALKSTCSPHCSTAQTLPGRTHALVADVSLAAGGAVLGGAVIWALASSFRPSSAGVALTIIPTGKGVVTWLGVQY